MKRTPDLTLVCVIAVLAAVLGREAVTSTAPVEAAPADAAAAQEGAGVERPLSTVRHELTDEMIDLYLVVARDIDERLGRQFAALRERNSGELRRRLERSARLRAMVELRRRDPSLYDLKLVELRNDAEVSRLATDVCSARDAGRVSEAQRLEGELRMKVILQLAFRHRAREEYICELREAADRMERELAQESEHIDDVIERRMHDLLCPEE